MRGAVVGAVTLTLLAGCGQQSVRDRGADDVPDPSTSSSAAHTPTTSASESESAGPSPIEVAPEPVLQLDGREVPLPVYTSCYANACIDGVPAAPYVDAGTRDDLVFTFAEPGWEFAATIRSADGGSCGRTTAIDAVPIDDRTFRLPRPPFAGAFEVQLSGTGAGDVHTVFTWTTTEPGTVPPATGSISLVHEGNPRFYEVEILLDDLPELVEPVTATVTATAANGRSVTLGPYEQRDRGCLANGGAYLVGPESDVQRAGRLGPGPFDYEVTVRVNGRPYVGTGVWPRDELDDGAEQTALDFDPPLPTMDSAAS